MTSITPFANESALNTNGLKYIFINDTPNFKSGLAVKYFEYEVVQPVPKSHTGTHIVDVIRQREKNPVRAAALSRARARLAQNLDDAPQFSLTALRLSKGLSQTKLAEMLDTQQPQIARWEKGDSNLTMATIDKLAFALGVQSMDVFAAVQATLKSKAIK